MNELKLTLKAARTLAGFTQKEVAKQLGIANTTVWAWENQDKPIKKMTQMAICNLYKIPSEFIKWPEKKEDTNGESLQ